MKHRSDLVLPRSVLTAVAALCACAALASAPTSNPAGGAPDGSRGKANPPRKQQPEARWVLPPVAGPNLHHKVFESRAAGEKVSYLIYLPPGYDESPGARFPVVYWLHGIGGNQTGVPRLCERVTQAIGEGKAPAMLFVFVNGMVDSFYCDALNARRPVESVIIKDLIPQIDATYRTLATRAGRMIEGFSMGGFGAARLGCKYPGLFGSISIIDGAMLELAAIKQRHPVQFERIFASSDEKFIAESPSVLTEKHAEAIRGRTTIRLEVGALTAPNAAYQAILERLKIDHSYEVHAGVGHALQPIYDRLGDRNWAFYRRAFATAK